MQREQPSDADLLRWLSPALATRPNASPEPGNRTAPASSNSDDTSDWLVEMPTWLNSDEEEAEPAPAVAPEPRPEPAATQGASAGIKIGILGGSGSGKTTYLAALHIAALNDPSGQWIVGGQNDVSNTFLVQNELQDGIFPPGTQATKDYRFTISGKLTQNAVDRILDVVGKPREVNFDLGFRDYAGRQLLDANLSHEIWQHLSTADGLIYLFDPEMEQTKTPNFRYLSAATSKLHTTVMNAKRMRENRLPHYLAVCVTKFDEPAIFKRIQEAKLVTSDDPPRASNAHAIFKLFANQNTVKIIENSFLRRQVRYFVTSSVGFYANAAGKFDRADSCNVLDTPDGSRIRGEVAPINVFTPLLWIDSQVRAK
ncbi:MAG: hypothetical protein WCP31_02895 [Chloroflexales bacterium]